MAKRRKETLSCELAGKGKAGTAHSDDVLAETAAPVVMQASLFHRLAEPLHCRHRKEEVSEGNMGREWSLFLMNRKCLADQARAGRSSAKPGRELPYASPDL